MIDFSSELNQEQLAVVYQGDGPCLVLAGAGSGKTRTITYRVAYLLEQGVSPENILLVTFTNKAAAEMISRVAELSSRKNRQTDDGGPSSIVHRPSSVLPWAGTFHHIAYKILRQYAGVLGYAPNFTILDTDDSEAMVKICIKNLSIETDGQKFPSANVVKNIISYARNAQTAIGDVLDMKYPGWFKWSQELEQIADDYDKRKRAANSMDFDDLLVNLLVLFSAPVIPSVPSGQALNGVKDLSADNKDSSVATLPQNDNAILQKYANQFRYILVDEYQDTNRLQASIVKKLASVNKNLLVVGDDAQSIYSFRAADIENILSYEKDYPEAKIFKLETNYRSSQEILSVANDVISSNVNQYPKNLKTTFQSGVKPELRPQADQTAEADFVVKKIAEFLEQGVAPKEIAVLFRASHHSQQLEMALAEAGIAYDYRGGLRFFERAHVKDILAYLRLLNNLADEAAWRRVLLKEEGIGPVAAATIVQNVQDVVNDKSDGNDEVDENDQFDQAKRFINFIKRGDLSSSLSAKAKVGWNNFLKIYQAMENVPPPVPKGSLMPGTRGGAEGGREPAKLVRAILDTGYADYLEAEYFDSRDRRGDVEQLVVFAGKFNDLAEFLAETSLAENYRQATGKDGATSPSYSPPQRGGDNCPPPSGGRRQEGSSGKIVLSTVHQAKGLEWSAVFLVNLASGAFPNSRAAGERGGIEEERRLFYVAITRAKKNLFLTYPMENAGWGDTMPGPSMFLEEIDSELLDDKSLLMNGRSLSLNDAEIEYVDEDAPIKIKPGSFLRDIGDL